MCRLPLIYCGGLSMLLLLGFSACHRHTQGTSGVGSPVRQKQQTMALQAADVLRKQWNSNACQAIYEQAAPPFRSQPLPQWLSQCEYFHPRWGDWRTFDLEEATACDESGKGTVCLFGTANFGTGRYDVILGWRLENQHATLLYWSLGQNNRALQTMPSPSKSLLDPPFPPKTGPVEQNRPRQARPQRKRRHWTVEQKTAAAWIWY